MIPLLELPARSVYCLPRTAPAVFSLADNEGGGVLINTPPFSLKLAPRLKNFALPRYVFNPSRMVLRFAPRGSIRVDSLNSHHYTQFTD